jgi:hypothetical protein
MRKTTIALAAAASLITSSVNGKDCSVITDADTVDLSGYPIATVVQTWYSVKREACFEFTSLLPDLRFDPDKLCVKIDGDTTQPLFLRFADGRSLDVSADYSSRLLRWAFDHKVKACLGLLGRAL